MGSAWCYVECLQYAVILRIKELTTRGGAIYVNYYEKIVIHFSCETFCGELGRETFENWAERVSEMLECL